MTFAAQLSSFTVPGGCSARSYVNFDFDVLVDQLVIPPGVAKHFDVFDVVVGRYSQLRCTGSVPAEDFDDFPHRSSPLRYDPVYRGQAFAVVVKNKTDESHVFTAEVRVRAMSPRFNVRAPSLFKVPERKSWWSSLRDWFRRRKS